MNAQANGIPEAYSCGYIYYFVIGGDGYVRWRGTWNQATIAQEIQQAIDDLTTTDVDNLPQKDFALGAAYPNPFNPTTTIPYELRGSGGSAAVRLEILDLRGRVIRTLVNEVQARGHGYTSMWNGRDDTGNGVASGLYMSRLLVDGVEQARMVTLVK